MSSLKGMGLSRESLSFSFVGVMLSGPSWQTNTRRGPGYKAVVLVRMIRFTFCSV